MNKMHLGPIVQTFVNEEPVFMISRDQDGNYTLRIDDSHQDFHDGLALAVQEATFYLLEHGASTYQAQKLICELSKIAVEVWKKDICDTKYKNIKWISLNERMPPIGVDILARKRGFVGIHRMTSDKKWLLKVGNGRFDPLHPACFPTHWAEV